MHSYKRGKGDWYYLFFPEVEKIEFKNPICCGKEMLLAPTDSGDPYWVCEVCLGSKEVE